MTTTTMKTTTTTQSVPQPRCPKPRPAAALLWLAVALCTPWATAQSAPGAAAANPTAPLAACVQPWEITPPQLYGLWQITLWTDGGNESAPVSTGALLFERHPEYPGSVRGNIKRSSKGNDLQALVSGDVLDGEFNLDESADGVNMDAVWVGQPQDCGQTIRGVRFPAEGRPANEVKLNFTLKKSRGWN
jgi:hypothetical protein